MANTVPARVATRRSSSQSMPHKSSVRGVSAPMCAWWMMTAASNPNGPTIGIIICAGARHRLCRCGGLRMGSMSIWHWILVLAVGLLLFGGRSKVSDLMGDFAKGIKSFKKGLAEDEKPEEPAKPEQMKTIEPGAPVAGTATSAEPRKVG